MRTVVANVCQKNKTQNKTKRNKTKSKNKTTIEKNEATACNSSNINGPAAAAITATNYLLELSNLLVLRCV